MKQLLLLLSLAFAIPTLGACSANGGDDGTGDDGGGDDGGGDDGSSTRVEPGSGVWHYTEVTPIGNDCDLSDRYGDNGDFGLLNHGNRTFTIEPNDGGGTFSCTMSGDANFDCPDRGTITEDFTSQGYNAVLTVRARAEGTFANAAAADGIQAADVSCAGSDCALAATVIGTSLPCTFSVDFHVVLQQPL